MKRHHVHKMLPNRLPMPTEYRCDSCAFRCTPNALGLVRSSTRNHVLVRAGDPQAKKPWNG